MDKTYLDIFLGPLQLCRTYQPKFGQIAKKGVSISDFRLLYGRDPFYSWVGLDSDLMYAAHRVAGGMTSVYRQIGIGCERLFRRILVDTTGYIDPSHALWSYSALTRTGGTRTLTLDGRLEIDLIQNKTVQNKVSDWIENYVRTLADVVGPIRGVVFEIRQGYKSKDSKRQNADIDNATVAWANRYLPVFAIFSSQIDADIVLRYRNNRCGILVGTLSGGSDISIYSFTNEILGYDLAAFFARNAEKIRNEVNEILMVLLSSGDDK